MFRHMKYSEASGSFSGLLVCLILLPDLPTDAFIFMFGELVAHLVDNIFQMLFQGFIF